MIDAFFFFIAGISPKVKVLDEKPRRCPVCGLHQAYYKRVDHYLSLFFIPIFKVKTGETVIRCDRSRKAVSCKSTSPAPLKNLCARSATWSSWRPKSTGIPGTSAAPAWPQAPACT